MSEFIFDSYMFDEKKYEAAFHYRYQEQTFVETLQFDSNSTDDYSRAALDELLKFYWLVAGTSYYKADLAETIVVKTDIDDWQAETLNEIYRHGLGEFLYKNSLKPDRLARFSSNSSPKKTPEKYHGRGSLVMIGGGKDSLLTTTILQQSEESFATVRVNANSWIKQQMNQIIADQVHINRTIDSRILSGTSQFKGHVPISMIISLACLAQAVLSGHKQVLISAESSADEPTVADYHGMAINHQWSKSSSAEDLLKQWLERYVASGLVYNSLLRPLGEVYIAEIFADAVMPWFSKLWSSSNDNFAYDADGQLSWDLKSPKTCSIFALLAPYVDREQLIDEFGGNPFEIPENEQHWLALTGKTHTKPFECVPTVGEMIDSLKQAAKGDWPEAAAIISLKNKPQDNK